MARGSIRPRPSADGKRVSYRVKWESRSADGRRQYHSATCRTKKEANALLAEKTQEVYAGTHIAPSKETVGEYLERWLVASAPTWRSSTRTNYESIVHKRIVPELGAIPLAQLNPARVQAFYSILTERYAADTVRLTHAVLHLALKRAVAWQLIVRNPTTGALLPTNSRGAPNVWTGDETGAFLKATSDHRFAPLWRLALDSGMRIGEILALTWRDVDFEKRTVSVRRTLTREGNSHVKIGSIPKTRASSRSIKIGSATVASLRTQRAKQAEHRLRLGEHWHNLDLVFDRGNGEPIAPNVINASLARILAANPALPRITVHGMRHTMATLLLAGGSNPKMVQDRLGHTSVRMTLDRYSHITPGMQDEAADILDAILNGNTRPKRGQETG